MNMEQPKTAIVNYGDGIYAIDQQMVRAFLIVGTEKALLLDTGAIPVNIKEYIGQITDLPVTVILTHGDGDHIGNLQSFEAAYCNENDHEAVLSHEPSSGVKLLALSEGDTFDISGRSLKTLFTPGHTSGSVCMLDEENKILFSGDSVSYGPVFMFGAKRNIKAYLETLKRLKKMEGDGVFTTVYCCHNTCPISADTIDELIFCVEGIINQTIKGTPAPMPVASDEKPLLCKYGKCMILIDEEK